LPLSAAASSQASASDPIASVPPPVTPTPVPPAAAAEAPPHVVDPPTAPSLSESIREDEAPLPSHSSRRVWIAAAMAMIAIGTAGGHHYPPPPPPHPAHGRTASNPTGTDPHAPAPPH